MKEFVSLTHITDVGASSGNGVDSSLRIKRQYERLGVLNPTIIPAGHSPLHVAFSACTEVSSKAIDNTKKVLELLGISAQRLPIALNSAPRNSRISYQDGKEDNIYRLYINGGEKKFLIYGPDVLRWVIFFHKGNELKAEKVLEIKGLIPDTSKGSQFRSAEHLPIAHVLEARDTLDTLSYREDVDIEKFASSLKVSEDTVIVVPPDEYGNGRLVVHKSTIDKISSVKHIGIAGLTDYKLSVASSLTNVEPDILSIWPSSNFFPNKDLSVLNIGTRWKPNTTRTTNVEVIELSKRLAVSVSKNYKIEF